MTRLDTLKSLQKRIQEATGPGMELDEMIFRTLIGLQFDRLPMVLPRYTTDPDGLGACVALQRSVLPRWTREVREMSDGFWVRLTLDSRVNKLSGMHACETHAHLLAIIAALIAEEEAKNALV